MKEKISSTDGLRAEGRKKKTSTEFNLSRGGRRGKRRRRSGFLFFAFWKMSFSKEEKERYF